MDKERIIIECLSKEYDGPIDKNMKLIEDLGLNSLQLISIVFSLEKKGLTFNSIMHSGIETVGDLINNVEVKK